MRKCHVLAFYKCPNPIAPAGTIRANSMKLGHGLIINTLTLISISSLNNPQNNEINFCENNDNSK
jgi:hypothetical protein